MIAVELLVDISKRRIGRQRVLEDLFLGLCSCSRLVPCQLDEATFSIVSCFWLLTYVQFTTVGKLIWKIWQLFNTRSPSWHNLGWNLQPQERNTDRLSYSSPDSLIHMMPRYNKFPETVAEILYWCAATCFFTSTKFYSFKLYQAPEFHCVCNNDVTLWGKLEIRQTQISSPC